MRRNDLLDRKGQYARVKSNTQCITALEQRIVSNVTNFRVKYIKIYIYAFYSNNYLIDF